MGKKNAFPRQTKSLVSKDATSAFSSLLGRATSFEGRRRPGNVPFSSCAPFPVLAFEATRVVDFGHRCGLFACIQRRRAARITPRISKNDALNKQNIFQTFDTHAGPRFSLHRVLGFPGFLDSAKKKQQGKESEKDKRGSGKKRQTRKKKRSMPGRCPRCWQRQGEKKKRRPTDAALLDGKRRQGK